VALINIETNGITVVPLINGIPELGSRLQFHGMGTTAAQGRDVAFDAAGNIYAISQGAQLLRVFSPGGTTTATTGSDGTFSVVRPATSVSVATTDDSASEAGTDTGIFTIFRTGDTTDPLTVNYTLSGTATNGIDYVTDVLSITIPSGASSADVVITPIDDSVTERIEDVVITLVGAPAYDLRGGFISASLVILDNEPATFIITSGDTNIYEGLPFDTANFTVTRLGDTNVDVFNLEIRLLGTATVEGDYAPPTNFAYNAELGTISMAVAAGAITVSGIITARDDHNFEGDETVVLELTSGSGEYVIGTPGSVTATIRDNECPPARVLFSDDFETDTSVNWIVRFGAVNGLFDATTNWAVDYSIFGIPPAPHSVTDSQRGLLVTVNKNDSSPSSAGINLYPANQSFSGDFALRFDLYISVGNSNATEHTLAGINHSGVNTNRASQTPANHISTAGADGIWFAIEAAAGNLRDYGAYTSTNAASVPALISTRAASTLTGIIQRPPYSFAGSPGNASNSVTKSWADVEVSQMSNVVTLKVNKNTILQVTNTYGFESGKVMIGYNDQFDSRGSVFNFAIFDNVQVVSLGIAITSIQLLSGNMVQIDFVSPAGGQAGDFALQSTGDLNSSWATESGAVITTRENGGFRAVVAQTPDNRFYRIRR
jgi:hypothetical protein